MNYKFTNIDHMARKKKLKFNREKFEKLGWEFIEEERTANYYNSNKTHDCYFKSPRMEYRSNVWMSFDDPDLTDQFFIDKEYEEFSDQIYDKAIHELAAIVRQNIEENYKPYFI